MESLALSRGVESPAPKRCSACGQTKPLDEFHRNKSHRDGRGSACKACAIARAATWLADNREHNRQSCAARYAEKREQYLARQKTYAAANAAALAERRRVYRAANRERLAAKDRAYRLANLDAVKQTKRAYYKAHADEIKAKNNAWVAANPDRVRARRREWAKAHPEAGRAKAAGYAARRRNALGQITTADVRAVLEASGGACAYCRCADRPLTLDHIVALAAGGTNTRDNLAAACAPCNSTKGARGVDFLMARLAERSAHAA